MDAERRDFYKAQGAVINDQGTVVDHFGDPTAEYQAATNTAIFADISQRNRIEITGNDRVRLINNLCTNDILKLAVGSGCEAFFLDAKGHLLDVAVAFAHADSLWLDVEPGRASLLINHLDRYVIREDIKFLDRTESHAQFHVTGPRGDRLVAAIAPVDVASWQSYRHEVVSLGGHACQVRRHDRGIEPGFDILVERTASMTVWQTLLEAARQCEAVPAGSQVLEVLRVEGGLPVMGIDIQDNLAQEIGRDRQAISFNKGCYLGQETVARLDAMGHVNRRLCGLVLTDRTPCPTPCDVQVDGKSVGKITSSVVSHMMGSAIAIALLRVAPCPPGTAVEVMTPDGVRTAKVASLPFIANAG